jgi:hypothetical protein
MIIRLLDLTTVGSYAQVGSIGLSLIVPTRIIPSKKIASPSTKRLDFGNQFLEKNRGDPAIKKAIELFQAPSKVKCGSDIVKIKPVIIL